jgi:hypothetical protein
MPEYVYILSPFFACRCGLAFIPLVLLAMIVLYLCALARRPSCDHGGLLADWHSLLEGIVRSCAKRWLCASRIQASGKL